MHCTTTSSTHYFSCVRSHLMLHGKMFFVYWVTQKRPPGCSNHTESTTFWAKLRSLSDAVVGIVPSDSPALISSCTIFVRPTGWLLVCTTVLRVRNNSSKVPARCPTKLLRWALSSKASGAISNSALKQASTGSTLFSSSERNSGPDCTDSNSGTKSSSSISPPEGCKGVAKLGELMPWRISVNNASTDLCHSSCCALSKLMLCIEASCCFWIDTSCSWWRFETFVLGMARNRQAFVQVGRFVMR